MKEVKRLRSTRWQLQNSHRDVKYDIENITNNFVKTMYGAKWVVEISGGAAFCKVYDYLTTMLYT